MGLTTTLKSAFIPNIKKCHRPNAFTHKWLKFYSLGLLLSQILLGVSFYSGPSLVSENTVSMAKNIIILTNNERAASNINSLKENSALTEAANKKLNDMFQNNYWDHTSPTNVKPWDFISKVDYKYTYAGENLAKGYLDSNSTVTAWMESTSHKENILNPKYTEIGVAVGTGKINSKPTTLVVQMFATPKTTQLADVSKDDQAVVLGVKENKLQFNTSYATVLAKIPYFLIWFIIFGLIVFDGGMLRRCGLHTSKRHLFEFRTALLINGLTLILLCVNFVAIS